MKRDKGDRLYDAARKYLVSGGSASARWNKALNRPLYFKKGVGSRLIDYDGNEIIDMCCSHGGSIMGHGHPEVVSRIQEALDMGILCSYETEFQGQLAKKIVDMVPSAELCRFTCSGTEATMHAIRLARDYTGRDMIIKFEGHFHGYHDYVQYSWAPHADEMGPYDSPSKVPFSSGMPEVLKDYITIVPFNDFDALEAAVNKNRDKLAAVILEPINYNIGCVVPDKEYMNKMRELTAENGIVLIYDEILSAFRTGPDCAQGYFGVTPDLCCIGKCVAGGIL